MKRKRFFSIIFIMVFLISGFLILLNGKNPSNKMLIDNDAIISIRDNEPPQILEITQIPNNPGYLEPVNVTIRISDNVSVQNVYIETNFTGLYDYLGKYSFTNDVNGADPVNWTLSEPANSTIEVIEEKEGYRKVVYMENAGAVPQATQIFGTKTPGDGSEIEWWVYGENGSTMWIDIQNTGPASGSYIFLELLFNEQKLYNMYNNGGKSDLLSSSLTAETWHHFRIRPTTSNGYRIWLNGIELGPISGTYFNPSIYTRIFFTAFTPGTVYFDAIDYSWAPGYYTNRNMIYTVNPGFCNYSMTLLSGSLQDGIWNFTFTDYPVNQINQYQIFAEDTSGNINVSDLYNFGYFDYLGPDIESITQEPMNPGYQDDVNVTAHITDNTGIQEILFEMNLTCATLSYDYFGKYSFTNDVNGTDPVNWTLSEPSYTSLEVIEEKSGHRKVVFMENTGGILQATQIFGTRTPGDGSEIEWWVYGENGSTMWIDIQNTGPASGSYIFLELLFNEQKLYNMYDTGGKSDLLSSGLTAETWHHFRIRPTTSNGYRIWLNGVELGPISGTYFNPSTYTRIFFTTRTPGNAYFDAIDYSWAPGYYTNRNMNYTVNTGFCNYSMTLLSGSLQDGIWNISINNYPLNKNINYRIFATDVLGNTNCSTSMSFGVHDILFPEIICVIQNPASIVELTSVNVTAIITDNFAISSVAIESNHTGTFENYTMNLMSGSFQAGNWSYNIGNYPVNKSIIYRIFAMDVVGNTVVSVFYNFGIFPINAWYVPSDLSIDIDIGNVRKGDISFEFHNIGNTVWLNLNFTINLPTGWTVENHTQWFNQLNPGEKIQVIFRINAPETFEEGMIEIISIDFEALCKETGDLLNGTITSIVSGVEIFHAWVWIIIILGSTAAIATTGYVFIKKRRDSSKEGLKPKSKSIYSSGAMLRRLEGEYSVVSIEVMQRINNLKGISDNEKDLLIDYTSQLNEETANKWLDELDDFENNFDNEAD